MPVSRIAHFSRITCSTKLEGIYGGMWDMSEDHIEHAHKMIAHIDKKRKALGIDKARERVLMEYGRPAENWKRPKTQLCSSIH